MQKDKAKTSMDEIQDIKWNYQLANNNKNPFQRKKKNCQKTAIHPDIWNSGFNKKIKNKKLK